MYFRHLLLLAIAVSSVNLSVDAVDTEQYYMSNNSRMPSNSVIGGSKNSVETPDVQSEGQHYATHEKTSDIASRKTRKIKRFPAIKTTKAFFKKIARKKSISPKDQQPTTRRISPVLSKKPHDYMNSRRPLNAVIGGSKKSMDTEDLSEGQQETTNQMTGDVLSEIPSTKRTVYGDPIYYKRLNEIGPEVKKEILYENPQQLKKSEIQQSNDPLQPHSQEQDASERLHKLIWPKPENEDQQFKKFPQPQLQGQPKVKEPTTLGMPQQLKKHIKRENQQYEASRRLDELIWSKPA